MKIDFNSLRRSHFLPYAPLLATIVLFALAAGLCASMLLRNAAAERAVRAFLSSHNLYGGIAYENACAPLFHRGTILTNVRLSDPEALPLSLGKIKIGNGPDPVITFRNLEIDIVNLLRQSRRRAGVNLVGKIREKQEISLLPSPTNLLLAGYKRLVFNGRITTERKTAENVFRVSVSLTERRGGQLSFSARVLLLPGHDSPPDGKELLTFAKHLLHPGHTTPPSFLKHFLVRNLSVGYQGKKAAHRLLAAKAALNWEIEKKSGFPDTEAKKVWKRLLRQNGQPPPVAARNARALYTFLRQPYRIEIRALAETPISLFHLYKKSTEGPARFLALTGGEIQAEKSLTTWLKKYF